MNETDPMRLFDVILERMEADPTFRQTVYTYSAAPPEMTTELIARLRDDTDVTAQKAALQELQAVYGTDPSEPILIALRDLLSHSAVLRGEAVQWIAETGWPALACPGMIEALLEALSDESAETRQWVVAALAPVADSNLVVRRRLGDIALADRAEAVRFEAEGIFVRPSTMQATLLDALRSNHENFRDYLQMLVDETPAKLDILFARTLLPTRLRPSFDPLEKLAVPVNGSLGDFEWSLYQINNETYRLYVEGPGTAAGQILVVRETEGATLPGGFIVLSASEEKWCEGEMTFVGVLPKEPYWFFHLLDWHDVSVDDYLNIQAVLTSEDSVIAPEALAGWKRWVEAAAARFAEEGAIIG